MPRSLHLVGKWAGRSPIVASAAGHNESLLFAWDSHSGRRFLVDTGAEVSVLPATGLDTRTGQSGPSLKAANGSSIKTYGVHTTKLCFASCQYEWKFIIADVARPLLGADFLRANSLLVDLKGKPSGCRDLPVHPVRQCPDVRSSSRHHFSLHQQV